jgi:hypothetical protein
MSLVSGKFSDQTMTLEDSSPDGMTRIRLDFDKGQLVKAEPASTVIFIGGG